MNTLYLEDESLIWGLVGGMSIIDFFLTFSLLYMFCFDKSLQYKRHSSKNFKENYFSRSHNLMQNNLKKRKFARSFYHKSKNNVTSNEENGTKGNINADRMINDEPTTYKQSHNSNKVSKSYITNPFKMPNTKRKNETEVRFNASLQEIPSNELVFNKRNNIDDSNSQNTEYSSKFLYSGDNTIEISSTTSLSDQDELSSCIHNKTSLKKLELEPKWPKKSSKTRQSDLEDETKELYDTWKNNFVELKKSESDEIKNEKKYKNKYCDHMEVLPKDSSFETTTTNTKKLNKKTNYKTENDKRIKKLIKKQKIKDKTNNKLIQDLNTTIKHLLLAKKKTSSKKKLSEKSNDSLDTDLNPMLSEDYQTISEDSNKNTNFTSRAKSAKEKPIPIDIHIKLSQTLKENKSNNFENDKKVRSFYPCVQQKSSSVACSNDKSFDSFICFKSERLKNVCTLENKNGEKTKIDELQDHNLKLKNFKESKSLRRNQLRRANKQQSNFFFIIKQIV